MKRKKRKRTNQNKLWRAAKLYCKEADKCFKARAYFSAIVARTCELEALLRIFDFVENTRPKDRCHSLAALIDRAFKRHWVPHDALRVWNRVERTPLKERLHEVREVRNGVHAHLFDKDTATRRTANNVTYLVHSMYEFIETKNARNLMKSLYEKGEISEAEYKAWRKKQARYR